MATYVATNVQNFPDPCCAPDQQQNILVVQADLSQSVGEGGVLLSAWSGVDAVSASALGAHGSAVGSGSSPTFAHPGGVAFNAGTLVYGVTTADGVVGVDGPQNWGWIATMSDNALKADGRYLVATNGGSVDPQWVWWFNSSSPPRTWLATGLALTPASAPPPVANFTSSCSGLTCNFDASSSTAQATATYSWNWGDATPAGSGKTATHSYGPAGTYNVTLTVTDGGGSSSKTQPVTVTAPSGIALDQQNSGVGSAGSVILKGFNPTNPHRGDAIVATFIWTGSTNVITSVTDHLATAPPTPVGNTYNLVEYVTAGGVSMATYVATNVQNFPDPCCAPDQQQNILVVQADLSQSVGEAGLIISAYSGVDAARAQAVGAHASAAGSGSSPTTAHPGPVGFNAGALVYGVTMSNAVVGIDGPPPPFSRIANISDNVLEGDGQYAVQTGAGSVDPSWTWWFNSSSPPRTWLATGLSLNPATASPPPPAPVANFTSSCSGLTCSFDASSSTAQATATYSWTWGDATPAGSGKTATH